MVVKSLSELQTELQKRIDDSLVELGKLTANVMSKHILDDVYKAYDPVEYVRRNDKTLNVPFNNSDSSNTGLMDKNNIVSVVNGNVLTVENQTMGSKYFFKGKRRYVSKNYNKPIAGVIETGHGYDVKDIFERPFIKNTRNEIASEKYHIKLVKAYLQSTGLEVK